MSMMKTGMSLMTLTRSSLDSLWGRSTGLHFLICTTACLIKCICPGKSVINPYLFIYLFIHGKSSCPWGQHVHSPFLYPYICYSTGFGEFHCIVTKKLFLVRGVNVLERHLTVLLIVCRKFATWIQFNGQASTSLPALWKCASGQQFWRLKSIYCHLLHMLPTATKHFDRAGLLYLSERASGPHSGQTHYACAIWADLMAANYREIQNTFSKRQKIKQFLEREALNVGYL